jgi:large conductance mechanosensitive channel
MLNFKEGDNMKNFWKDFKDFISKGNVIDLAIAVIVGGAFGKIVTSMVNDIIMPLISLATGGVSISDWKWVITPASEGVAESAMYYGNFIQTVLDFLIISFFIFLAIRIMQKSKTKIEQVTLEIKKKKGKNILVVEDNKKENTEKIDKEQKTTKEDKDEIISSITKITKQNQRTNKNQEKLLTEIRDLLKNNNK